MSASGVEVRHGFTHAQERRARYGADLLRPQHGHVDQFDIPHESTWAGIPPLAERFPNKSSDGPPAARSAGAPVTSLYRNNSIKKKKAALMDELRVNVENVIRLVGIDQCGLATFTTRRNCNLEEFQHLGAAMAYGVPVSGGGDNSWISSAALRDLAFGCLALTFALLRDRRAMGLTLLFGALIPIGDAIVVLRNSPTPFTYLPLHLGGAIGCLVLAAILLYPLKRS